MEEKELSMKQKVLIGVGIVFVTVIMVVGLFYDEVVEYIMLPFTVQIEEQYAPVDWEQEYIWGRGTEPTEDWEKVIELVSSISVINPISYYYYVGVAIEDMESFSEYSNNTVSEDGVYEKVVVQTCTMDKEELELESTYSQGDYTPFEDSEDFDIDIHEDYIDA